MKSISKDKKINKRGFNFKAAFYGFYHTFMDERSFRIELALGLLTIIVCAFLNLSSIEWCLIIISIGGVFSLEVINTIVENIMDFVHFEYHPMVGKIKDMGSALVLINCAVAVSIACFIIIPKIWG